MYMYVNGKMYMFHAQIILKFVCITNSASYMYKSNAMMCRDVIIFLIGCEENGQFHAKQSYILPLKGIYTKNHGLYSWFIPSSKEIC